MSYYLCKRCNFKSNKFGDIRRHLNKKKQCIKKIDSYNYTNDQLLILSMIPYNNDKHNIDFYLFINNNYNNIFINKDKLFDIITNIDKNKIKDCPYCNTKFDKIQKLKDHIILTCFNNIINSDNINSNINDNYNIINNNIINNPKENDIKIKNDNQNIYNITNINNITNIHLTLKNPIPFDEKWDISKIDDLTKKSLLFSKIMYTNLLEEILKNDINLNVIIDKNSDSGIVYKNNVDKYIEMKIKDIIENSMEKLHKHLIEMNNNELSNNSFYEDIIKLSYSKINDKYNNYKNNIDVQKNVEDYMKKLFENKRDNALLFLNNDLISEGF